MDTEQIRQEMTQQCLLKKEMRACCEECTFPQLKAPCGWNRAEQERRHTLKLQEDADGIRRLHIGSQKNSETPEETK